jgi:hypothetical protein
MPGHPPQVPTADSYQHHNAIAQGCLLAQLHSAYLPQFHVAATHQHEGNIAQSILSYCTPATLPPPAHRPAYAARLLCQAVPHVVTATPNSSLWAALLVLSDAIGTAPIRLPKQDEEPVQRPQLPPTPCIQDALKAT